ncbi:tubulin-tyrosine ligase family-domain-containing protein [Umbelopsis sp. PMI_123]|nr:tubulin-tyrosine ligase family-domain-containing protein [Umbelopsis sp. PMI_123]
MQLKARVQFDQPYTHELVKKSLKDCSKFDWIIEENITNDSIDEGDLIHLQWLEYELINWDTLASRPTETLANSYCIRKGLIRKSQMAYNLTKYMSKNPESILKDAIPETWLFELDHIDYLDEAMNEVFEVERDLADNEGRESDRKAFIIKPSMANKAAGIHIFDTMEGLQALFERTRLDSDDQDDDEVEEENENEEEEEEEDYDEDDEEDLSQIREWVIQRYVQHPLLLCGNRKFHVRAYVLAVSNIQVYLYSDMLALFALKPFDEYDLSDQLAHITNTCVQTDQDTFVESDSVKLFWDLKNQEGVTEDNLNSIFKQMQETLRDIFDACTSEMTTFQAIPNAFELYGIDFLIDKDMKVYFLEANAFPDFKQTGNNLQHIIGDLFAETIQLAVDPFFEKNIVDASLSEEASNKPSHNRFVKVFERQLLGPH